MEKVVDKLNTTKEADDGTTDKFQAVEGHGRKRQWPTIEDDDPDLDRYNRAFDGMVAVISSGSKRPRPIDILHWYRDGFKPGSIRGRAHDNAYRRAETKGRLPHEAKQVLDEIRKRLTHCVWNFSSFRLVCLF